MTLNTLRKISILVAVLLTITVMSIYGGAMNDRSQSVPRQFGEWKSDGKTQSYDRQTIFKYIDGGAELYLSYDFRQVSSRKYTGPNNGEIIMDIYDMGNSADAFGVFSSEREDADAGIGQGSDYGGGLLRFWKGSMFVSILATEGGEKAEKAVLELGKIMDKVLPSIGSEPSLLKYIPKENLDMKRTRYFHTSLVLEKHYYIANENILDLDPKTEGILAEYPTNDKESMLLLYIRYENYSKAKNAYDNFIKVYMPEAKNGLAQMENKKWTMAVLDQNIVRIVFEAPEKKNAFDLHTAVRR